jgi:hypothetical protein
MPLPLRVREQERAVEQSEQRINQKCAEEKGEKRKSESLHGRQA